LDEFIQGIQLYFNKMLSTSLLYGTEQKQYHEISLDENKESSSVYGVEHLLRLFGEYIIYL
jgi:mortality factor 4-like protein 1